MQVEINIDDLWFRCDWCLCDLNVAEEDGAFYVEPCRKCRSDNEE